MKIEKDDRTKQMIKEIVIRRQNLHNVAKYPVMLIVKELAIRVYQNVIHLREVTPLVLRDKESILVKVKKT